MKKAYFMVPMKYRPSGKGIMGPMEYNLKVYSPNEKGMVYERLFFEVVIVVIKDLKKMQ